MSSSAVMDVGGTLVCAFLSFENSIFAHDFFIVTPNIVRKIVLFPLLNNYPIL